jgi:ankyrin repeat protein
MSGQPAPNERVTQIIGLLRPERPRKLPESLTTAAMNGDIARMELFLARGANIEERSVGFISPLAAACSAGQTEAARWLIARGAKLDPPGALVSPLHSALGKGYCETAAVLLDAGLPLEHAAWGVDAAAITGNLEMLRWLLSRGIDLDATYPRLGVLRQRALASAEKAGKTDVLRFLRGEFDPGPAPATPPAAKPFGMIRPRAAPEEGDALLAEALALVRTAGKAAARWTAKGSPQSNLELVISYAARHGVAGIVRALLDLGANPDFAPEGTPPPLFSAAEAAEMEIVRLLLERGAAPNGASGNGWLPLQAAATSGDPEIVRTLLEAGANPRAKPFGGVTLAQSARGPYAAEIRALLEQAALTRKSSKKAKPQK